MNDALNIQASEIIELHDAYLLNKAWPNETEMKYQASDSLFKFIEANHFFNTRLWNEEDLARRQNVSDSEITKNKRAIDKFNQSRNDQIEQIDSFILEFAKKAILKEAKQNSETLGAMVDRLSILSLKIFHMSIQTRRENVSELHIQTCSKKLEVLKIQRNDLCACFDELLYDCILGFRYFKQYKQFKMYNDPNLNPQLYAEKSEFKQN
ncbi:DUF4254 domain-containing protein [Candidatus Methylopumilus universalis]|uniref:DUF4254 domain-containing protein n=1 Tax=Candidatus Methylopumilus universalis TaxID=2588536 RepID=UPI001123A05E|nr:DUF4254 domain-containing protein [Candidatus Methylopumilus universalis]QDC99147.1 DUF4254 domain-containing protein [Candidatus Methylopumilus universalis]